MTDQPAAQPTPRFTVKDIDDITRAVSNGYHTRNDYPPFNADIFRDRFDFEEYIYRVMSEMAALETAAERDQLVKVNEGLADALEKMMASIHAMREGDAPPLNLWQELWDEARAVLGEAAK